MLSKTIQMSFQLNFHSSFEANGPYHFHFIFKILLLSIPITQTITRQLKTTPTKTKFVLVLSFGTGGQLPYMFISKFNYMSEAAECT